MTLIVSPKATSPSRRTVLRAGAALLAAPAIFIPRDASAADPLVMVTWGGAYQDLLQKVFVTPFSDETKIPMRLVSGPDLAKAKAQIMTGNIEWDLFDGVAAQITSGEVEGLWEPVQASAFDPADMVIPFRASSAPFLIFAGGIGYVPGRAKDGHPKTFAEFWDVKAFPGRRALRTRISETLEVALLADGVDPKNLYPLDIERGFKSLDRIKPHVAKWIDQTPQTISLLQSNEIDYVYTYNGRVASARKEGADIGFATEQTLILNQYLAVLKGSKRRDEAMKFLSFVLRPDRQAEFANAYYSIPVRKSAMSHMSAEVRPAVPDVTNPRNVVMNDSWWTTNFVTLDRRFKEWLATG
jgi:putative spermidine/putrescine transport system substrate-binding protein